VENSHIHFNNKKELIVGNMPKDKIDIIRMTDELAVLANMLVEQQDKVAELEKRNTWLRETGKTALDYHRWWWRFIPLSWQRKSRDKLLLSKGLFDREAYVRDYPDVITSSEDPLRHYFYHGIFEDRHNMS